MIAQTTTVASAKSIASKEDFAQIRLLGAPRDYFAETRTSLSIRPEKILCFARKSGEEIRGEPLTRHHHHRYVLVIPWREEGNAFIDDRRFALRHPDALLIFPFQFHHGIQLQQEGILWQFVTFELKDGAALEALRLEPLRRLSTQDHELALSLAAAWNTPGRQDELADWLALLLKRLLSAPQTPGASSADATVGTGTGATVPMPLPANSLLLGINDYCMTHLHQLFGLKEIAAHLAISESYLRARFREEMGVSLGVHLRSLRLQKAIGLLMQSDLSITQVAERCGFDSIFAFSRSFRRYTGLTASEYRQGHNRKG